MLPMIKLLALPVSGDHQLCLQIGAEILMAAINLMTIYGLNTLL
jgi:hypothetical protein